MKPTTRYGNLKRHCTLIHGIELPPRTVGRPLKDDEKHSFGDLEEQISTVSNVQCKATTTSMRCHGSGGEDRVDDLTDREDTPTNETSMHSARSANSQDSALNFLHGELPLVHYKAAVKCLLEKHEKYDIHRLCDIVRKNYPDIPSDVTPYVVLSTNEGAMHVAKSFQVFMAYKDDELPRHKQTARKAVHSMTAWAYGVRSG